jgi:nitrogen fixation/metabolism regulation signal transduction histidine kinase
MAVFGRIWRQLAVAIVLTALIPVLVAIVVNEKTVRQTSARFFIPEVGARLDESLGLYQDLARAIKEAMGYEASAIAAGGSLRQAARAGDRAALERELRQAFQRYPRLVSLSVRDAQGRALGSLDRGQPLNPEKEHKLELVRSLSDANDGGASEPAGEFAPEAQGPELVAVFAADKARLDGLEAMSNFVDQYRRIERRREADESSYVLAFAALLGLTIIAAVGVGALLARGVSSRIGQLAEATRKAGAGDLSTRVAVGGADEITDLARGFNRMFGEIESNRARIEYLQRMAAWQEMARRLAHEIKNPLTPIQLAIQDVHRRYPGSDPEFKRLLDTALEIVEDEVGSLHRLVSEFSAFARLPQANLKPADLAEFLRDQSQYLALLAEPTSELPDAETVEADRLGVRVEFELPGEVAMVYMDREMMRRALINLIRNADQALNAAGRKDGRVTVRLSRQGDFWEVDVEDNGPGIPLELRHSAFDPYVTTKTDGSGLGLAIVKKIVIEHGGSIGAEQSALGGALVQIRLPAVGTAGARAALEARDWQGPPSSRKNPSGTTAV